MPAVRKQSPRKTVKKSSKPRGLLSQASEISFEDEGLKVALYGRSGTGKTTFWSSFPKPILALICSGGKRSGELRSIQNVKGVKQFQITSSDQIIQLSEELLESEYKTVVLDHGTHLQDLALKETLGLEEIPVQKTWGIASQQQYGQVGIMMKEYLRSLFELPKHVVIVTQEREFGTDLETNLIAPSVGVALSPSVAGWLHSSADYIVETFIRKRKEVKTVKIAGKTKQREVKGEGVEYCLRTGPDEVYTTKFRVPKGRILPDVIVDPTFQKMMNVIQGKGD